MEIRDNDDGMHKRCKFLVTNSSLRVLEFSRTVLNNSSIIINKDHMIMM